MPLYIDYDTDELKCGDGDNLKSYIVKEEGIDYYLIPFLNYLVCKSKNLIYVPIIMRIWAEPIDKVICIFYPIHLREIP